MSDERQRWTDLARQRDEARAELEQLRRWFRADPDSITLTLTREEAEAVKSWTKQAGNGWSDCDTRALTKLRAALGGEDG